MLRQPKYTYALAVADWVIFNLAFVACIALRFQTSLGAVFSDYQYALPEIIGFSLYSLTGIIVFQYNNLYNVNVVMSVAQQVVRLVESLAYMVVGIALLSFFSKLPEVVNSRLVLLLFFPIALGFLVVERFVILRGILKFLAKHEIYQRRLIILGAGRVGRLLAANLSLDNPYGIKILGYLDNTIPQGTPIFRGLRVLGKIEDLTRIASDLKADEIVLSVENVNSEELFQLLELSTETGATVKIASPLYDIIESFRFTERYGEIPVVGLSQRINGTLSGFSKRLFDFVLAAVGMVILSPVFAAIALAIKLDSRGSIFYRQTRVGKNGKVFDFYKFRSMLVGSDQDETRKHKVARLIRGEVADGITDTKIVDESKITRVGKFIRKTSLDELPQLMNVLLGDMSLVGPRPCLPYEWEHYEEWQKKRLSAMPGCTGVWQVSGRNTISFDDMVIMDFYYIQNSSLLLDLQLILKTIPVMVFGRGGK